MRALLVAAGAPMQDTARLRALAEHADCLLCADGGWQTLERLHLFPDAILGDFDSLASTPEEVQAHLARIESLGIAIHRFPIQKDKTDTELALDYALAQGMTEVLLVQGMGTRLDHGFSNLLLLRTFQQRGLRVELIDDTNRAFYLLEGAYRLPRPADGSYVSFFSFPSEVRLSLEGFEYNLDRVRLPVGSSFAVSNHILEKEGRVSFEGEGIYCMFSRNGSSGFRCS